MKDYLNICIEAVGEAAGVCRTIQDRLVDGDTLTKADRSPVSVADFAAQAVVCRTLKRNFPDIPVVGEEEAEDLRKEENRNLLERIADFLPGFSPDEIVSAIDHGTGAPAPLFFTLDPIDGTKGFLRGDQYAVALAMIRQGEVVMGILGCPNLDLNGTGETGVIAYATKGKGAFHLPARGGGRPAPMAVSRTDASGTVRFLESVESGHANHGRQARIKEGFDGPIRSVRIDSQAKYAVLAAGGAEVYLRIPSEKTPDYREKIWDHAAGSIVVREAGGTVTDIAGKPLDFGTGRKLMRNSGVIGTNGVLHGAVLEKVK